MHEGHDGGHMLDGEVVIRPPAKLIGFSLFQSPGCGVHRMFQRHSAKFFLLLSLA